MSDQEETSGQEEIFEVEKIVKKRINAEGKAEYFIKWKDYAEADNTWEPVENLECGELMEEFENLAKADPSLVNDARSKKKRKEDEDKAAKATPAPATITKSSKKKDSVKEQTKSSSKKSSSKSSSQGASNVQKTGFDEGLTAESIIGATDSSGKLMYLIKWKERNEASLVDSVVAHQKCPGTVISYLSQKITFLNETENEE